MRRIENCSRANRERKVVTIHRDLAGKANFLILCERIDGPYRDLRVVFHAKIAAISFPAAIQSPIKVINRKLSSFIKV